MSAVEKPLGRDPLPVRCGLCGYKFATPEEAREVGTGTALDHWPCGFFVRRDEFLSVREAFPACYYSEGMGV